MSADLAMPAEAEIEAAKTAAGGWTREQLAKWGVPWPPPKGWKEKLIREARAAEFRAAAARRGEGWP